MTNILETIIAHKRVEVAQQKEKKSVAELEKLPLFTTPAYSLKRFLLDGTRTGIIAEYKRKSPSKGIINNVASVSEITAAYSLHGAAALSILTDEHFFGGTIDDVITARINTLPILRKEFIIDEYQIIEAKAIGVDAILLIAAVLTVEEVKNFALLAHSLGLEVLLELHDESELNHIVDSIDVVGINNRNLKTFAVSLEHSIELSNRLPKEKIKISESGIHSIADINYLKSGGFNGFLIGENFMKNNDPGLAFAQFVSRLNTSAAYES